MGEVAFQDCHWISLKAHSPKADGSSGAVRMEQAIEV